MDVSSRNSDVGILHDAELEDADIIQPKGISKKIREDVVEDDLKNIFSYNLAQHELG
jgi:hypothetical protein